MNKQDLINTKWDARDWSDEMKRKWEARVSELGFFWLVGLVMVNTSDIDFYFLHADGHITLSDSGCADKFFEHSHIQCAYSVLFPKTITEQGQKHDSDKPRDDLLFHRWLSTRWLR